jgi:glycosyltransferase involved in cell wall biosynthesis
MAPIISGSSKSDISLENDIEVLRVKTYDIFSKNTFKKGLSNLLLSYQFKKAYLKFWHEKPIDVIIVATPSVMFADFVGYLKKLTLAKVYLMQKDIFPQNAVDLGLMKKKSLIYNFFRKNELKLLKTADVIGFTSPGNINYFLKNYPFLNPKKFKLIYNSSKLFTPAKIYHTVEFYNLKDKFLVVFGGNLGRPQQLENILILAQKCRIYSDVVFLILGNGTEVDKLKREVKNLGINNIEIFNSLAREAYFNLLSNCNVGLISLHQNFSVPNTPMKLNDYLNAGIPVLASIDRATDLGELLVQNNMGLYAYADSMEDLFRNFTILYQDEELRMTMGRNGYDFCVRNLSVEKTCEDIIQHIEGDSD